MIEKLLKKVKDEKYESIDFKFSDIHGSWRHLTIPAENFNELIAGLDGIKNKIDPGEAFDGDFSKLSAHQIKKYPLLPFSLARALEALSDDLGFLREDDVFSKELIDTWIKIKQNEVEQVKVRPHPWEFRLYYDA